MPLLNAEQAGWLRRLNEGPLRRDANPNPLPYGMATIFLDYQLIEPSTETSHGFATMTWRTWKITEAGQKALRFARRHSRKEAR